MHVDEPVVKSHGDFMDGKRFVFHPVPCGIENVTEFQSDTAPRATDIFIASAEFPGPLPRFPEKLFMELLAETFRKKIEF